MNMFRRARGGEGRGETVGGGGGGGGGRRRHVFCVVGSFPQKKEVGCWVEERRTDFFFF